MRFPRTSSSKRKEKQDMSSDFFLLKLILKLLNIMLIMEHFHCPLLNLLAEMKLKKWRGRNHRI
jgi:hypothetical protein